VRYSETMDVLVEMKPGGGWLARENDRIVFLPKAETIDVAHDVIEPLLIPRDVDDSFATFRDWIHSGRPLPAMLLVNLDSSVRLMTYDIPAVCVTEAATEQTHRLDLGTTTEAVSVGTIASLVVNDDDEQASGMLVEGVVRASGLRLHMHRGWGTSGHRDTDVALPVSNLQLELDGKSIEIGNGLVIGRWPYSHPDFDDTLEPLILSDPAVSRLHALVQPAADGLSLIDRGSHNGSWVIRASGESIRAQPDETQALMPGDKIRVGDTILSVA
jgi:hypothetical protein